MPLPDIPSFGQSDTEFRRFWNAVREWVQVRQGVRGLPEEAYITERRLQALGVTQRDAAGNFVAVVPTGVVTALPTIYAYAHVSSGTATAGMTLQPDGTIEATNGVTKQWFLNGSIERGRDFGVKFKLADSGQPSPGVGTLDAWRRLNTGRTLAAEATGVAVRVAISGVYTIAQYGNATYSPRLGEGQFFLVAESQMPGGGIPI